MATLNTLRTRGALFLSIVIGVALIAFLLGDLTSASSVFQSRRNRVGSINGTNIDYMEFVTASDNLEQVIQTMYGQSSLNAAQQDQVHEMMWEQFLYRYSYQPGYNRMGLGVGEAEMIDMVQGTYTSPVVASLFASPATGEIDRTAMANFVASLDQDVTGRMPALWEHSKNEMTGERTSSKFMALVSGGSFVNNLEVAQGVASFNNIYNGRYAMLPFTSVADSLVEVSSSEVRAFYRAHKNTFRQAASRDIEYVNFEIAPSEADYAQAATYIAELAAEFATAEDPMQYASLNSQERTDPVFYTEAQLSGDNLAIAFGERVGEMTGPTLNGNIYTVSRVAAHRMLPDSVGARHILLPAAAVTGVDPTATADSLVTAIRGGADIFALAPLYSVDQMIDLGRFPPEMMVEPFAEAVIAAGASDVFSVETQFGTHVVQMTYKGPQVNKAQIATITYNVEPSAATEQAAYTLARDFLAAAAGSKEKFDEAVASTGANRRVATIGERDREVMGLTGSRELVRWSFNTKPGTVSPIMDIDGDYVVAVLTAAKESGVADVRDAAPGIVQRLRNEKKAEMLAAQAAGKSVDEVAAMTGATSGDVTALQTNAFYDPTLGVEPAVIGAFGALSAGATSKPIHGYGGVYVVSVTSVDATAEAEAATEASERVRLEANAETLLPQRLTQALAEESEIEDYRAKFF
ncbi:MAG: SurA N-terminal domain-containing protein [Alistipes sp.]|jgi:peptidyl-prolyl cis-trans isomerase D|nr:SurA N-terminal domain-containing protein [Alistipes sp.]